MMGMETKPFLASKTIWGGIIAFIPLIADYANQLASVPAIPPKVAAIIASVGGLLAIVGRFTAVLPIK